MSNENVNRIESKMETKVLLAVRTGATVVQNDVSNQFGIFLELEIFLVNQECLDWC